MKVKLSNLAEIRRGIKIEARSLVNAKPMKGNYYAYLEAENFIGNTNSKYVADKDIKKLFFLSNYIFLNYGDYLIYKHNEIFKVRRFEQVSGQTLPSDTFIVIRYNDRVVGDFLNLEKNKQSLYQSLQQCLSNNAISEIQTIANVEIVLDSIKEIEAANFAKEINFIQPFDSDILPLRITQKVMTLDQIIKRIYWGELIVDLEFQKKSILWNLDMKSRFIESLIVSMPVPTLYFDATDDDKWFIIDGLQRVNTIMEYLNGSFELTSLDFLSHLQGKRFIDLERAYQRNMEEYQFHICLFQKGTPESVKYKIYKNINSSRLAHSLNE